MNKASTPILSTGAPSKGQFWPTNLTQSDIDHKSPQRGWIQSRSFDLSLFTLSPLAGLFVVLVSLHLSWGFYLSVAATYLVAIPHYLSTFSFYLGDENLSYYWTRRAAFFLGPVAIFGSVLALRVLKFDAIVQSTMFVWNIYHVSLQSAGILSLYRRLNGGPQYEKPFAHLAILSVNATMAFWYLDRFAPLFDILQKVHPSLPSFLRLGCLSVAVAALGVLFLKILRRPNSITLAEGGFLMTSLLLFHPYLWVKDSNLATFGMLMGHFIQYLAIVWLLHYRKYADHVGSPHQQVLSMVSHRLYLLFGVFFGSGMVFYLLQKGSTVLGMPMFYTVLWNALTLMHFYLDGLIWAFKRPFVRTSIGPYLTPDTHRVLS